MPNTRSAKKRVRSSLRKRARNRAARSSVKTVVARARRLTPTAGSPLSTEEFRRAISALDKAAEKGVLHPNNAGRRKARLMRALARLAPAPAEKSTKTARPARPAKPATRAKRAAKVEA